MFDKRYLYMCQHCGLLSKQQERKNKTQCETYERQQPSPTQPTSTPHTPRLLKMGHW